MLSQIVRWLRHRWADDAENRLPKKLSVRIAGLIAEQERKHSGEVRVCIEAGLPTGYLLASDAMPDLLRRRALSQFSDLGVWDTEHNNGVLIYLCLAERAIEVVADRGIHQRVPEALWSGIVSRLSTHLQSDAWEAGIEEAIHEVSSVLVLHFPLVPGQTNPNELADQAIIL